jgi:hypothetical protein
MYVSRNNNEEAEVHLLGIGSLKHCKTCQQKFSKSFRGYEESCDHVSFPLRRIPPILSSLPSND